MNLPARRSEMLKGRGGGGGGVTALGEDPEKPWECVRDVDQHGGPPRLLVYGAQSSELLPALGGNSG